MINFSDVMTRLYNQITEVKTKNLLPYYLFLSKDVYDVLRTELPRSSDNRGIPVEDLSLQFVEGLEVVVGSGYPDDYLLVKGIKTNAIK